MATQYQCEDCPWAGLEEQLAPIKDVHDRVMTGELMAAGCCPDCGSLISVADVDVPDYTLEACASIMRKRGWKVDKPRSSEMRMVKKGPIVDALWWFIENVGDDHPERNEMFFALRERMRRRQRARQLSA